MNLEGVYIKLPRFAQNLACSAIGLRTELTRYNGEFRTRLAAAQRRLDWGPDQRAERSNLLLSGLIEHCRQQVPYYRDQFRALDIGPGEIRRVEDLPMLPILEKHVVRNHPELFQPDNLAAMDSIWAHTSGSTGAGLHFPYLQSALREQWAIWWRYRILHGIEPGQWCGYFGGRTVVPAEATHGPWYRVNRPGRQILFSAHHMSEAKLPDYITALRRFKPAWLHGYPSTIALLAGHIAEHKIDLGYQIRWVSLMSENVLDHQAAAIRRAFEVDPIQHYGMAEAVANISQHPDGRLVVDEDFSAVEFDGPADAPASILGTSLTNLAFPLLRYRIGDLATVEGPRDRMGRRIVRTIDGREEDYLITPNGAKLTGGTLAHIFKYATNVAEAQIHQPSRDRVVLRIVRTGGYTATNEAEILAELRKRLGSELAVAIDYVPVIEKSPSGKLRMVVSDLR